MTKPCKDCVTEGVTAKRKMVDDNGRPYPGPRCATHHRAEQKRLRTAAHARRVENGYNITSDQYWALYEAQGGRCPICYVATGRTKRLAVDHDHHTCSDHDPKVGCPRCIRGLLCGRCNQVIGQLGLQGLCRAVYYLQHPPAKGFL